MHAGLTSDFPAVAPQYKAVRVAKRLAPGVGWFAGAAVALAASGAIAEPALPWATAATIAAALAAAAQSRRSSLGYLAPFPLFIAGMVLYILPMALTLLASGVVTDSRGLADDALARAVWVSSVALAATVAAYVISLFIVRPPRPFGAAAVEFDPARAVVLGVLALGAGTAAITYFVFGVAGFTALATVSYGNRYLLMQGHGFLTSGLQIITVGALVLFAAAEDRRYAGWGRAGMIIAGLVLLGWTLLVGSRSAMVNFILAALVLRHAFGRRVPALALALLGAVFIVLFALHAMLDRTLSLNAAQVQLDLAIFRFNPANSEFGSAVGTLADVVTSVPDRFPFRHGMTYIEGLGALVPSAVWPERTLGPARWYVNQFYPDVASEGGAYAFSAVAEAYLNFGMAGVVAIFGLIGCLLTYVELKLSRYAVLPPWVAIAYALATTQILMFSRNDAGAFIKSCFVVTLGPLVATAIVWRLLPRSGRRATAPAVSPMPEA